MIVDLAAMCNLDDENDGVRLDCVGHAVVADSEASGAFHTVAERLSELDRMRYQFRLDGSLDSALYDFGKAWNIGPNDALQIFNSIVQGQALSCEIRFCLVFNRASAMREKWRSS